MKKSLRIDRPAAFFLLAGLFFASNAWAQPNAWQITDNSTAGGSTLGYTNQLATAQRIAATNAGFRFTVNARFVTDFGGARTMNMSCGLGRRSLSHLVGPGRE